VERVTKTVAIPDNLGQENAGGSNGPWGVPPGNLLQPR